MLRKRANQSEPGYTRHGEGDTTMAGWLEGKVALITGAAAGLGMETVKLFAAEGAKVIATDIDEAGGRKLAATHSEAIHFVRCDVSQEEDIIAAVDAARSEFGGLDILFNNAGIPGAPLSILDMTTQVWEREMAILLRGPMLGIKYAAPLMRERGGGAIVNTASISALQFGWGSFAYSTAKAGLVHMTHCVAAELAPFNIRVNAICPGVTATSIFAKYLGLTGEAADNVLDMVQRKAVDVQPLRRPGLPEDIAQACLYLSSGESRFVTGTHLVVDGGLTTGPRHAWDPEAPDPARTMGFTPENVEKLMAGHKAIAVSQDANSDMAATGCPVVAIADDAIFTHPDRTDTVDCLDDPVSEIATKFHAIGPVIKGHGVGVPLGSQVRFGDVTLPNMYLTARACAGDVYAAVSWEAVRKVFTTPKIFSSKCFVDSLGLQGPTLTTMDPPEHTKYRRVVQPAFTPAQLKKHDNDLIRPSIARRFAELRPKGRADLVRDLTPEMAFEINGTIVGFDAQDVAFLATCRNMIFGHDEEAGAKGSGAQNDFTRRLIEKRRAEPRDDLISQIVHQKVDGEPIPERNLLGLVNVVLGGGIATIYKLSGNMVTLLLDHPDQFDLLRADRSLIPRFVDEAMRFENITTHFPRVTTEDIELEGVAIPAGSIVIAMMFAADRDSSRWDNPNVLDVMREPKNNVAFSAGTHSCLGAPVARLTLACFIEHLIDDLPNLRWDPERSHPGISGWTQRAALTVPVVWDMP